MRRDIGPCLSVVIGLISLLTFGCGQRAVQQPTASAPARETVVPLPEWAPESPSPEFLRAARVLRGVPMDAIGRGDMPEQSWRALWGYMKHVNPMLWQLFGSLTDAQIDRFLAAKAIAVGVRDLTPTQTTALQAVLDANKGRETEISGASLPDFRTLLYKMGASEDLSNVTVGFTIEGANMLSFNARVAGVKDPLKWTGWAQVPLLGPKTPAEKSPHHPAASARRPPLPEWAPENPSPEFLRAARVLKPMPDEFWGERAQDDLSRRALSARYGQTLTAAWEFFGTLSDEQMERLRAAKEIRIPFTSLTEDQRAALLGYFDVWRDAFKGVSPTEEEYREDWLVELYRFGAREDLSNVEIRFLVRASGIVAMMLRVRQPDGSLSPPLPAGLGQMATRQGGNSDAE